MTSSTIEQPQYQQQNGNAQPSTQEQAQGFGSNIMETTSGIINGAKDTVVGAKDAIQDRTMEVTQGVQSKAGEVTSAVGGKLDEIRGVKKDSDDTNNGDDVRHSQQDQNVPKGLVKQQVNAFSKTASQAQEKVQEKYYDARSILDQKAKETKEATDQAIQQARFKAAENLDRTKDAVDPNPEPEEEDKNKDALEILEEQVNTAQSRLNEKVQETKKATDEAVKQALNRLQDTVDSNPEKPEEEERQENKDAREMLEERVNSAQSRLNDKVQETKEAMDEAVKQARAQAAEQLNRAQDTVDPNPEPEEEQKKDPIEMVREQVERAKLALDNKAQETKGAVDDAVQQARYKAVEHLDRAQDAIDPNPEPKEEETNKDPLQMVGDQVNGAKSKVTEVVTGIQKQATKTVHDPIHSAQEAADFGRGFAADRLDDVQRFVEPPKKEPEDDTPPTMTDRVENVRDTAAEKVDEAKTTIKSQTEQGKEAAKSKVDDARSWIAHNTEQLENVIRPDASE